MKQFLQRKLNRLMTLRRIVQNKTATLQDIKRQKTQEAHLTAKSLQVSARREHISSPCIFCNKAAHAVGGSNAPEVSASAVATGATTKSHYGCASQQQAYGSEQSSGECPMQMHQLKIFMLFCIPCWRGTFVFNKCSWNTESYKFTINWSTCESHANI